MSAASNLPARLKAIAPVVLSGACPVRVSREEGPASSCAATSAMLPRRLTEP